MSYTKRELELLRTALQYAIDYYDGEASLSDMADLLEKVEKALAKADK